MQDFQTKKKKIFFFIYHCGDVACLVNKQNAEECVLPNQCVEMKSQELDIAKGREEMGNSRELVLSGSLAI